MTAGLSGLGRACRRFAGPLLVGGGLVLMGLAVAAVAMLWSGSPPVGAEQGPRRDVAAGHGDEVNGEASIPITVSAAGAAVADGPSTPGAAAVSREAHIRRVKLRRRRRQLRRRRGGRHRSRVRRRRAAARVDVDEILAAGLSTQDNVSIEQEVDALLMASRRSSP